MSTLDKLLNFAQTLPGLLIILFTFALIAAKLLTELAPAILAGAGILALLILVGFGIRYAHQNGAFDD